MVLKFNSTAIFNFNNFILNNDINIIYQSESKEGAEDGRTVITHERAYFSTNRSKGQQESPQIFDKFPKLTSVPESLKMDFSTIIDKPIYTNSYEWADTSVTPYSILYEATFPDDFLINSLIKVPFTSSVFYRTHACLQIQVSGTPMHSGCLLAFVLPIGAPAPVNINQALNAPHAFLFPNESTPVCLEVPFYSATTLRKYWSSPSDRDFSYTSPFTGHAKLFFMLVNSLVAPLAGTKNVVISISTILKDSEFYVPKVPTLTFQAQSMEKIYKIPTYIFDGLAVGTKKVTGDLIDGLRGALKMYTGFHNPNSTAINHRIIYSDRNFPNNVDQPTLMEKLDPYTQYDKIYDDYYFMTDQDEMDMKYLLSKPAFLGSFNVKKQDNIGKALMCYPITPLVEINAAGLFSGSLDFASNLRTYYELSKYWRGSINMHIQAVMTNFHFCKIQVTRNYATNTNLFTSIPQYQACRALPTDVLEFSAGGQVQTVNLPYCAVVDQLDCTKCLTINAAQHGMVYLYLASPLITNGSVSDDIKFNIYYTAGPDFQYFGYATDPINVKTTNFSAFSVGRTIENKLDTFVAEAETIVSTSSQGDLNLSKTTDDELHFSRHFHPIVNVRDYMRRFYQLATINLLPGVDPIDKGTYTQPISKLISPTWSLNNTAFGVILGDYYGFRGGLKFKICVSGTNMCSLKYVPPGISGLKEIFAQNVSDLLPSDPLLKVDYNLREKYQSTQIPSTCPIIERPSNYFPTSYFAQTIPTGEGVLTYPQIPAQHYQFECVVPQCNIFNFTGGPKIYGLDYGPQGDFGNFIFGFIPATNGNAEAPVNTGITITFQVAFADETRLGFQCYNRLKRIPGLNNEDSGKVRTSVYNGPTGQGEIIYPFPATTYYFKNT